MANEQHILAFNGLILALELGTNKEEGLTFNIVTFTFDKISRTFTKYKEKKLCVDTQGRNSNSNVVKFEIVLEKSTGLRQPFLLLEERERKIDHHGKGSFIYRGFYVVNLDVFVEVGRFSVDHSIVELNVRLCDGPAICWTNYGSLCFAYPSFASRLFEVLSHKVAPESDIEITVFWCGYVNDRLVAMGTLKNDMCQSKLNWIVVDQDVGVMPNTCALPDAYAPIVTSCTVMNSSGTSSCYKKEFDNNIILVTTSMGQLLVFAQGKLRNHCQLPFSDASWIGVAEAEAPKLWVVVKSKTNKLCAVSLNDSKVKAQWENVCSVLLDDILELGREQILLLHLPMISLKDIAADGRFLDKFTLVDPCGVTISSASQTDKVPEQAPASTESLQKTVQALKFRHQVSVSHLRELQMEYKEKEVFIRDTCRVIQRLTQPAAQVTTDLPDNSTKLSTEMVCLIEGTETSDQPQESAESFEDGKVAVASMWRRVVADNFIVGVEVLNTGKSKISHLSLSLVSHQQEPTKSLGTVTCQASNPENITQIDNSCAFQENTRLGDDICPFPKRRKTGDDRKQWTESSNSDFLLPGQQTCVVVATDLPKFTKGNCNSWSVVLTWRRCPENGMAWQHKDSEEGRVVQAMCCGSVSLTADDVLDGRFDIGKEAGAEGRRGDLLAAKCISMETRIQFKSTLSSLTHVSSMIRGGLGLTAGTVCDVTPRDSEQCLLDAAKVTGPCQGVAVVIQPLHKQARVQLFTRNTKQVYLVLHRLREILPDDVIIDIDTSTDEIRLSNTLTCLQNEVNTLSAGLRDMISLRDTVKSGTTAGTSRPEQRNADQSKEEKLQVLREQFEASRGLGAYSKDNTARPQRAEEFWNSIVLRETQTNNAMVALSVPRH